MRGLLVILAVVTMLGSMIVLISMRPKTPDTVSLESDAVAVKVEPVEPKVIILEAPPVTDAICVLQPTAGHTVSGRVTFHEHHGSVTLRATIYGLAPNSSHGFHIHELGDTSAADGSSAGSHYNPADHNHALPDNGERHAGDLGNITSDSDGAATFVGTFETITLNGIHNPILGRAMILHAKQDDGGQPTGNAGPRIAMGVIGVAAPKEEPSVIDESAEPEPMELEATTEDRPTAPPAPIR